LQRPYSIIMINESNKYKTQRRLQRTTVSVITHATHAFTLREHFNATYIMHKIQRTQATQETSSHHNPDADRTEAKAISMKSRQTIRCTYTTLIEAQKNVNIPVVVSKCFVKINWRNLLLWSTGRVFPVVRGNPTEIISNVCSTATLLSISQTRIVTLSSLVTTSLNANDCSRCYFYCQHFAVFAFLRPHDSAVTDWRYTGRQSALIRGAS